ncbi:MULTISPECIES: hypothetical protein [Actinomadura]|jgi:hypothetical protein|uniref:Uncharacterized protein n=1 Tax=Actinomadura montaniterrae TaxID=1803903 RepID=A0A6L3VJE6_9ACTN|nr:hypothetical protein [Actinomadura montaniterrae]KAB2357771.1 hypothetical protein F9B16_48260 [Actinomadura montaniterrae]
MTWLRKIDEALGWLLRHLAVVVVAACTLGLLASVALIVAGFFRISPFLALGAVGVVAVLLYLARNTEGGGPYEPW